MAAKQGLQPIFLSFALAICLLAAPWAYAQNGTWTLNNNGNWGTAGNWGNSTIADGADNTAFLSNVINANRNITLDTVRTIGHIYAQDTSNNYSIIGSNALTLDVTSGQSTLDVVSNRSLTISTPVIVNGGISKTGAGTVSMTGGVTLGAAQTWTNDSGGALAVTNANVIDNAGHELTIDGAGTINLGTISSATPVLVGSGALVKSGSGRLNIGGVNSGFTGTVTVNGGVMQVNNNSAPMGVGNLTLNGGVFSFYWGATFNRTLGTGDNEVQLLGGESGFAGAGTNGPTINLGSSVMWGANGEGSGATGFFNPTKFVLGDEGTTNAAATTFASDIDLNGATRTIVVPAGLSAGRNRSTISGNITNSTGTGSLVKEGGGWLTLSGASTSWNGDTTVTDGFLFTNSSVAWGGNTTVSGGILDFANNSLASVGGGSGRNVAVASGAAVRFNAVTNALLNRIVETTDEIGIMSGGTANSFDFSSSTGANLPNAFLGNWASNGAKAEFSGTITPASDNYRLGAKGSSGLLGIVGTNKVTGTQGLIVGMTGASGIRVELAAANDFTGNTVINSGAKLTIGNNLAIQNSVLALGSTGGTIAFSTGNLSGRITGDTTSNSPTFGGLSGSRDLFSAFSSSGGNNEQLLANTAMLGFTLNPGDGVTASYSGAIGGFGTGATGGTGGAMTLTKTGNGTQILSGNHSYTGATTINAGILSIAGSGDINSSSGITLDGGTLHYDTSVPLTAPLTFTSGTLSGNGTLAQDLVVNGSIAPGNSIGVMSVAGNLTWNGAASSPWVFELGAGDTADLLDITSGDFLIGTGTAGSDFVFDFAGSVSTGTFNLVMWSGTTDFQSTDFTYTNLGGGNTGSFAISGSTLQFEVIPVPEPGTLALVVSGLAILAVRAHRASFGSV